MKNKIQILMLSSLLCMGVNNLCAQADKTADAFSTSYTKETNKDYTGAIAALKAVNEDKSYEINLRLGWLQYEAGQYKESMLSYQTAIDLMPYSIEARLGYTYPAAALGNTDQLVAQYTKILNIDPQNSTANYQMGLIHYNKKDYQNAFNHLEKVVNLYPFSYNGLLLYAWTNYRLGKNREAKILFTKVLWLSPGDKSATEGLGLIK